MMYTLVPLGNRGEKYEHTRHNVARVLLKMIENEVMHIDSCEILIPDTFMNESGKAVAEYMKYHEGRELIVMYDDKDLAYGTFRISHDRGDGGHNGLKSVINSMGTKEFIRIRVGIAPKETDGKTIKAPHGTMVQSYVMSRIRDEEEVLLRQMSSRVLDALKTIIMHDYTKAMEIYNAPATQ